MRSNTQGIALQRFGHILQVCVASAESSKASFVAPHRSSHRHPGRGGPAQPQLGHPARATHDLGRVVRRWALPSTWPRSAPLASTPPSVPSTYQRLCARGKPKKLALTACMRKVLTILNDIVRHQTLWQLPAMAW